MRIHLHELLWFYKDIPSKSHSLLTGVSNPSSLLISLPDPGSDRHAGGAGDLLRAAAAQAAAQDVLPEEGEAAGPPGHPGARPPVLRHRVQAGGRARGEDPPVRQRLGPGLPQRRPHDPVTCEGANVQ